MTEPTTRTLDTIIIEKKERVATITLNRPEKLNAMSPELICDLIEALDDIQKDQDIRALIITGAGRAFLAGGDVEKDLKPLAGKSSSDFYDYMKQADLFYKALFEMEKPAIAAINGHAVGAGLDLALACDIRIVSEEAQLGQFFVRMGLVPEAGAYLMPRLIGLGRAKLLSFTGDLVDAHEAERIGLVEQVVAPDELIPTAWALASRLAHGPKSIEFIKKQLNESINMDFGSALDLAIHLQYQCAHTEDHREAVNAFLEKRKPLFKGR